MSHCRESVALSLRTCSAAIFAFRLAPLAILFACLVQFWIASSLVIAVGVTDNPKNRKKNGPLWAWGPCLFVLALSFCLRLELQNSDSLCLIFSCCCEGKKKQSGNRTTQGPEKKGKQLLHNMVECLYFPWHAYMPCLVIVQSAVKYRQSWCWAGNSVYLDIAPWAQFSVEKKRERENLSPLTLSLRSFLPRSGMVQSCSVPNR